MAYFHRVDEYPNNAASPTGQPGCFTCGSPRLTEGTQVTHDDGQWIVDLDITTDIVQELNGDIHAVKVAVMCEMCIEHLGNVIGCISATEAARLLTANQSMAARLADYENMEIAYEILKETLAKVRV